MSNAAFWNEFAKRSGRLAVWYRNGSARKAFDEIDELMAANGHHFCFDIGHSDGNVGLFITPEGDPKLAAAIDSLVRSAPLIPGWNIFGRRQKKDPYDFRAILRHLYWLDPADCRFKIEPGRPPQITLFVPEAQDITPQEQADFADVFLWHALGEGNVMDAMIKPVVKKGIPDGKPLLSLDEFLAECDARFGFK